MKKFFEVISNIWKIEELRRRILVTLGLLVVYRFGAQVVLPGIDTSQLAQLADNTGQGIGASSSNDCASNFQIGLFDSGWSGGSVRCQLFDNSPAGQKVHGSSCSGCVRPNRDDLSAHSIGGRAPEASFTATVTRPASTIPGTETLPNAFFKAGSRCNLTPLSRKVTIHIADATTCRLGAHVDVIICSSSSSSATSSACRT